MRAFLAAVAMSGCVACAPHAASPGGTVRVVAGFYPLAYVAERVGGPDVRVTNLTRPGAEPHDVELTTDDVVILTRADLVLYLKGVQPALDDAARGDSMLDLATVVPVERHDPHVWVDPVRMLAMVDAVRDRLSGLRPARAGEFGARAAALADELRSLDAEYRRGLATCARRDVVTSHEAFGYLTRRYGLTQVAIAGISPEQEPSPRRLAEVVRLVRSRGATTVFVERLVSRRLAETIANEAHVRTAVLDPVEGVTEGNDYLSVMRANLAALRAALGCR